MRAELLKGSSVATGDSPDVWGEDVMHLVLPYAELPTVSDRSLTDIAAEFQPQLEMFRSRLLSGMDTFVSPTGLLSRFELARRLVACIPEDAGIEV